MVGAGELGPVGDSDRGKVGWDGGGAGGGGVETRTNNVEGLL